MIGYFEGENDADQKLLQELYDAGLFWAINHAVLHQHGFAIGVTSNTETPEVPERLILIKLDSEEDEDAEIIFSAAAGLKGYKKYLDYIGSKFDAFKRKSGREMDQEGEVFE